MSNRELIERLRKYLEERDKMLGFDEKIHGLNMGAGDREALLTTDDLCQAVAALEACEWRTDMENAPKDGSRVLLAGGELFCEELGNWVTDPISAQWDDPGWLVVGTEGGYVCIYYNNPTRWKPLDTPPVDTEEGET